MSWPTSVLFVCICAALPFDWFPLLELPGIQLKALHMFLLLFVTSHLFSTQLLVRVPRVLGLFAAAYLLRLAILVLSLAWSERASIGAGLLVRDLIYFIGFFSLSLYVYTKPLDQLRSELLWGGILGAVMFYLLLSDALNANAFVEISRMVFSLEFRTIKSDIFFTAIKEFDRAGATGIGGTIAPKVATSVGAAFITSAYAVHATAMFAKRRQLSSPQLLVRRAAGSFVFVNAIYISLWAYSTRVNLLTLAVICALVLELISGYSFTARFRTAKRYLSLVLIAFAAYWLLFYLLFGTSFLKSIEIFIAIFSDARFVDFYQVLDKILESPIYGFGYGSSMNLAALDYDYPHNIFLAEVFFLGAIGILTSTLWMAPLGYLLLSAGRDTLFSRDRTIRSVLSISVICIFFVVVQTQSAAMGQLDLVDWYILALGFGFWLKTHALNPKAQQTDACLTRSSLVTSVPAGQPLSRRNRHNTQLGKELADLG